MAKKKQGNKAGERGGSMARFEELSVEELEALRVELKEEHRRGCYSHPLPIQS